MRRTVEFGGRLFLVSALAAGSLSGCAPTREVLMIDRQIAAGLGGDYADIANRNLDLVDKACKEVPGYIAGSEKIAQFVGADGKLHGWAFCNGEGGTWVAGHMSEGKSFVPVVERFVYTEGTDPSGNSGTLFGYVEDGKTFGVYEVVNGVRQVVHPNQTEVKVITDEAEVKFWEGVVQAATGATDVAAAPEESTPTEEASATVPATKTDTPTAKPSETVTASATPKKEATSFPDMTKIPKNAEEVAMCPEIPSPVEDLAGFQKGIADALKNFDPNAWEGGMLLGNGEYLSGSGYRISLKKDSVVQPAICLRIDDVPLLGVVVEKLNKERGVMFFVLNPDQEPVDPNNGYLKGVVTDVDGILQALASSFVIPDAMIVATSTFPEGDPNSISNTEFSRSFYENLPPKNTTDVFKWINGETSDEEMGPVFVTPLNIQGYED